MHVVFSPVVVAPPSHRAASRALIRINPAVARLGACGMPPQRIA
jgi:hypothetical protein